MELVFTGEFPPLRGGIGSYVYARCKQPPGDGLRVLAAEAPGDQYVTPNQGAVIAGNVVCDWDRLSGLDIRRFRYRRGQSLALRVRQVRRAHAALGVELRQNSYRLVTAAHIWPFGWMAVRQKNRGHRVANFCYGAELLRAMLSAPARWFYRHAMSAVDRYIAISPQTADILVSHGWDRARIRVIPPPIDSTQFHPGLDGSALRSRWTDGGTRGPVLLTVCRLDDLGKGIDVMLSVIMQLRDRFPDIRYVLVGDGPRRPDYERMACGLGLEEHVIFMGRVGDDDLPRCYTACDAFVLMSRFVPEVGYCEGFGIVYREAMACGKPVIVSKEAGLRDYVVDGETCLLADPTRVDEIARTCADLLGDPARAARMGERAVQFAAMPADWSPLDELC